MQTLHNSVRRAYTDNAVQPEESVTNQSAASPQLQLVVFAGEEVRTLDLPMAGTVTIGRDEGSAVCIDDPSVSRNHAVLRVGPRLGIEDLGSANGTMIRDRAGPGTAAETLNVRQLMGRKAELAVGDTIVLGTARVIVRHAPTVELPDLTLMGDGVVVRDQATRDVYQRAARAAPTPLGVLILGETGVGKEVLARAIHAHSLRQKGPFIGINCGALSDSLLESELFGHEKGAFTGAAQARAGLFEAAAGGTVFLDEVGELSPATQVKLLRVLAERVVMRLGSTRPREIDVRIIAATNRDIETESRGGRFREDLFFRLNGISLTIPPLRDRPGEIDDLARSFLAAACRLIERAEIPRISREVFDLFHRYSWRGNVRELRNAMEHAAVLCPGDTILPEHLPAAITRSPEPGQAPNGASTVAANTGTLPPGPATQVSARRPDLPTEVKSLERVRILEALEHCDGIQSDAARLLGISRRTLISRIEEFGLPRPRKRAAEPDS